MHCLPCPWIMEVLKGEGKDGCLFLSLRVWTFPRLSSEQIPLHPQVPSSGLFTSRVNTFLCQAALGEEDSLLGALLPQAGCWGYKVQQVCY